MNKKANFDIEKLIIPFLSAGAFAIVVILIIILTSAVRQTSLVCGGSDLTNGTVTFYQGTCWQCETYRGYTYNYNTSTGVCVNSSATSGQVQQNPKVFSGDAYNATTQSQIAMQLFPSFMQILVVAVIFVVLLGGLFAGGFLLYRKMKE